MTQWSNLEMHNRSDTCPVPHGSIVEAVFLGEKRMTVETYAASKIKWPSVLAYRVMVKPERDWSAYSEHELRELIDDASRALSRCMEGGK